MLLPQITIRRSLTLWSRSKVTANAFARPRIAWCSSSNSRSMSTTTSLIPPVESCRAWNSDQFDGIVVVAPAVSDVPCPEAQAALKAVADVDKKAEAGIFLVPTGLPAKRIIWSGVGPLDKDYDDIRSYAEAVDKGLARAISAGCKSPLLYLSPKDKARFPNLEVVSLLGALKATYVPLEVREKVPDKAKKADKLGVLQLEKDGAATGCFNSSSSLQLAKALEAGKIVCRDIGGSDPERMAAPRVEEYVRATFADSPNVKIEVQQGQETFEKEYPCLAAVNRAASLIKRHDGRVIWLTYEPEEGPVTRTWLIVGKGVTYDTGGADIKAGGIMVGMSRDKCGAASVAGIVKAISILKPRGVKVIGVMGMIRNSVGEDCYVSDEIITSRAGVRIRVGNTDAEGRMVMVDLLCHAKEKALSEVNPHLFTIATLTGHVKQCYGNSYSAIMDNGPARKERFAQSVQEIGEAFGDPFEISTIRREDFEVNKDSCGDFVDVLQVPSAKGVPRGHQYAAGFLQMVSGLDKHMLSSSNPLKYSHLDIAGSKGGLPGPTLASTVVTLVMKATEGLDTSV